MERTMYMTETFEPFFNEKKETKHPTIIVDSREATTAPKIIKGLKEKGITTRIKFLKSGDYLISDECAFERKTVQDFVYTLTKRHLFDQLFLLKESYPRPFILIEGYLPIIYKYSRVKPASVWGAMFALAKQGINLIHTTNYRESVDFLYTSARQEQIIEKRTPIIHPVKKNETLVDAQIFFLSSLPKIGREKAIRLLNTFENPFNVLVNLDKWAKDVHGVGPKITKNAKKVLYSPYNESNCD